MSLEQHLHTGTSLSTGNPFSVYKRLHPGLSTQQLRVAKAICHYFKITDFNFHTHFIFQPNSDDAALQPLNRYCEDGMPVNKPVMYHYPHTPGDGSHTETLKEGKCTLSFRIFQPFNSKTGFSGHPVYTLYTETCIQHKIYKNINSSHIC